MKVEISDQIISDSQICHGKPTFKGTRVMVWQVLEMLEMGAKIEEILESFPALTKAHVKAALRYATNIARGMENVVINISAEA